MGLLKQPHFSSPAGACKGSLHIAEQLAFQQIFRQGRTVDGYKGTVFPAAAVMDALSKQLLSRSGFTHDDHVGIRCRVPPGRLYGLLHGPALVEDVVKGVSGLQPPLAELSPDLALQILDQGDIRKADHCSRYFLVGDHRTAAHRHPSLRSRYGEDPPALFQASRHDRLKILIKIGKNGLQLPVHEAHISIHLPHHPVSDPDHSVPIHVQKTVLRGINDRLIHLGDHPFAADPVHRAHRLIHSPGHRILASFYDHRRDSSVLCQDTGRISPGHSVPARSQDPFHGLFQIVMKHRSKHRRIDPHHTADLLSLKQPALKATDGDLSGMKELLALDHRPQHIITGNIQTDGGYVLISGNGLLG